jgi:hypothetical protein
VIGNTFLLRRDLSTLLFALQAVPDGHVRDALGNVRETSEAMGVAVDGNKCALVWSGVVAVLDCELIREGALLPPLKPPSSLCLEVPTLLQNVALVNLGIEHRSHLLLLCVEGRRRLTP